ncbi:MAG: gamma carbonic anhydrase family protein [Hyphomicrobiales bacterium]|nr:gamma carbonic anhydrase family protein [Hyphomicrobiales bacterium]MCY4053508.1 gamma carbonic anhydrase family protein [Hyphomicrobiales bacterium]
MTTYRLEGVMPSGGGWVAPGAHVIGNVVLGEGASVWFGAVLRGDNERIAIGAGSNIQDGCVLHTDPGFPLSVGENVTVGHRAVLHGCRVEERCLVGIGAIILNGAVIGRESLIAAGALVGERVKIPERSLVLGVPGRVLKQVTDEQAEAFEAAAQGYMERARKYREELQTL